MPLSDLLIFMHLAATLFMTGLIWFVQVVHYPLMAQVPKQHFKAFQQAHVTRTTWVVGPPMLLEAACALRPCLGQPCLLRQLLAQRGFLVGGIQRVQQRALPPPKRSSFSTTQSQRGGPPAH